jgi:hypothetical protein
VLRRSVCRSWSGLPLCSCIFPSVPGAEVDVAQEGSWRPCFVMCSCLAAKSSHMAVDVDGLVYPLHQPMACSRQMRGPHFMLGAAMSRHAVVGGGVSPGDAKPSDWDICWSVDRPSTRVIEFLHGACCFYQCTFTLWWSSCGVYAHIPDQASKSDNDETDPTTRVYIVRSVWAPAVMSYLVRQ